MVRGCSSCKRSNHRPVTLESHPCNGFFQLQIVMAESCSPVQYTVSFVDYYQPGLVVPDGQLKVLGSHLLRRSIEDGNSIQVQTAIDSAVLFLVLILVPAGDISGVDPFVLQFLHLVTDKRQSWLNDQSPFSLFSHHQSRQLVDSRFACRGRCNDHGVITVQDTLDGFDLMLAKLLDSKLCLGLLGDTAGSHWKTSLFEII